LYSLSNSPFRLSELLRSAEVVDDADLLWGQGALGVLVAGLVEVVEEFRQNGFSRQKLLLSLYCRKKGRKPPKVFKTAKAGTTGIPKVIETESAREVRG